MSLCVNMQDPCCILAHRFQARVAIDRSNLVLDTMFDAGAREQLAQEQLLFLVTEM